MLIAAKLFQVLSDSVLENQISIMKNLNVTNLYVRSEQILKEKTPQILNNSKIKLWLIAPIFYNDENLNLCPTPKWAICDDGKIAHEKSLTGNWLKMVCPSDIQYLNYRIKYLRNVLSLCNFTGISLDFMRYFVFWEGVFENTSTKNLRNSCFCNDCINRFKKLFHISEIHGNTTKNKADFIKENFLDKWTKFKCMTINETVEKIVSDLRKTNLYLKVNLHAVPWAKNDFDGSIKSIVGQDFSLLSDKLQQLSPMTYSKMLIRNGQWINDLIKKLYGECGEQIDIIPAIQCKSVYGEKFRDTDFEDIIKNAVKPPSKGVSIWPFEDLSSERIAIIKRVLK
jgi:hypothetical protein